MAAVSGAGAHAGERPQHHEKHQEQTNDAADEARAPPIPSPRQNNEGHSVTATLSDRSNLSWDLEIHLEERHLDVLSGREEPSAQAPKPDLQIATARHCRSL